MNEHALRVLEFEKVREIIARLARSGPGRERVLAMLPATDPAAVAAALDETREVSGLLQAGEALPLEGVEPIGPAIERLGVGSLALRPAELLAIASTLAAGRRLKAFFGRFAKQGAGPAAPRFAERTASLPQLKHLEDAVQRAVDATGEIKDSASPELRRIRKYLAQVRDEVLDRMGRILKAAEQNAIAQDEVITVRDDRYVLPLKPNFRQTIKGVVHGQSGSRATLFVEPLEVVEQNNRLAELRDEERDEIERILRELTALIARHRDAVAETLDAIAAIDAVHARARFGADCAATVPALSPDGNARLRQARHPLLVWRQRTEVGGRQVVPNDIACSRERPVLVISGPNAGGKTVILKTIGLLCLMAQAGVPVTAAEGSELPVLREVFADIGDEQDLDQDLSTFSSHVSRIAEILSGADEGSLVLLDELGSGTDPAEGGAFGSAVLARLLERRCLTVVTTHHNVLKLFGSRTAGAVNAAMEFDPVTLKPTYRFVPGRPGRSYGLDMAARLGIPGRVIEEARALLTGDEAGLDRLLEQIEQDALVLRREREQAETDRVVAAARRAEAEAAAREAKETARSAIAKAKQEAREVLADLRKRLKELARTGPLDRNAVQRERQEIDALSGRLEPAEEVTDELPGTAYPFQPGERVQLPKLKKTGTILFVHKDGLEIEADGIKLRVPAREAVPQESTSRAVRTAGTGWQAELQEREGVPDRIDLLGMRVAEAVEAVDRFLDRAGLQGFHQVTVIHGLGTGALKEAVTAFLKGHPLVASLRPGEPAEGGAGVTVAELKT